MGAESFTQLGPGLAPNPSTHQLWEPEQWPSGLRPPRQKGVTKILYAIWGHRLCPLRLYTGAALSAPQQRAQNPHSPTCPLPIPTLPHSLPTAANTLIYAHLFRVWPSELFKNRFLSDWSLKIASPGLNISP